MAPPSLQAKRSNPSFRTRGDNGLLRGACHPARIRATRWLAMTCLQPNETSRSRGALCPSLARLTLEAEGAGNAGARCTRGLACECVQRDAHTSIQVQRRQPGIPRARESMVVKKHRQINAVWLMCPPWCHCEIDGAIKPHKVLDRRSVGIGGRRSWRVVSQFEI